MESSAYRLMPTKFILFGLLALCGCSSAKKTSVPAEPYLLKFGASWCPPCVRMVPLMERLEKEEGVRFTVYDIDTEIGSAKFDELNLCPAIPLFVNLRTKAFICGAVDYETLKEWALEKSGKK